MANCQIAYLSTGSVPEGEVDLRAHEAQDTVEVTDLPEKILDDISKLTSELNENLLSVITNQVIKYQNVYCEYGFTREKEVIERAINMDVPVPDECGAFDQLSKHLNGVYGAGEILYGELAGRTYNQGGYTGKKKLHSKDPSFSTSRAAIRLGIGDQGYQYDVNRARILRAKKSARVQKALGVAKASPEQGLSFYHSAVEQQQEFINMLGESYNGVLMAQRYKGQKKSNGMFGLVGTVLGTAAAGGNPLGGALGGVIGGLFD